MLGSQTELELFEKSQLGTIILSHCVRETDRDVGSLCCETAEEAKTLIPSLSNKISDINLQELLDDITKLRNFVE